MVFINNKMKKVIKVLLVVLILLSVVGCSKNDGYKFKKEYTSINGKTSKSGKTIRKVNLSSDNPMKYKTAEEIVEMIDSKETFIVYFGFAECPWCRSILEELLRSAKDNNIETIYYVDVLNIRDKKEVVESSEIKTVEEGTKGYQELIKRIDNVLDDYKITDEVSAGKRIYAPNVVAIYEGEAIKLETGISEKLEDPYAELTEEIKTYAYQAFNCLFKCLEKKSNTCQKNSC